MTEAHTMWLKKLAPQYTGASDDDVLRMIDAAFARTTAAERLKDEDFVDEAEVGLRDAIDAARDEGVAWGVIAEKLGIARGNAYRKYRKRPL